MVTSVVRDEYTVTYMLLHQMGFHPKHDAWGHRTVTALGKGSQGGLPGGSNVHT